LDVDYAQPDETRVVLVTLDEIGSALAHRNDPSVEPVCLIEAVWSDERRLVQVLTRLYRDERVASLPGRVDPITNGLVWFGRLSHATARPEVVGEDLLLPGEAAFEDRRGDGPSIERTGRNALAGTRCARGARVSKVPVALLKEVPRDPR